MWHLVRQPKMNGVRRYQLRKWRIGDWRKADLIYFVNLNQILCGDTSRDHLPILFKFGMFNQ